VGIGLAGKYLDRLPYHVWVLCGDSETAEGSVWEALDKAAYYQLANLTAIVDVNRLGQRGPTELQWDLDTYVRRVEAFGCRPLPIDGHDLAAIDTALAECRASDQPTVVLARTIKGKGVPEGSRASRPGSLSQSMLTEENLSRIRALDEIAKRRGQTLAQLAITWVLRDPVVTSALVGASSVKQLEGNVAALDKLEFSPDELKEIDRYATESGINLWATSSAG